MSTIAHVKDQMLKLFNLNEVAFGNPKSKGLPDDVKLMVITKDGFKVSIDVHKSVVAFKS